MHLPMCMIYHISMFPCQGCQPKYLMLHDNAPSTVSRPCVICNLQGTSASKIVPCAACVLVGCDICRSWFASLLVSCPVKSTVSHPQTAGHISVIKDWRLQATNCMHKWLTRCASSVHCHHECHLFSTGTYCKKRDSLLTLQQLLCALILVLILFLSLFLLLSSVTSLSLSLQLSLVYLISLLYTFRGMGWWLRPVWWE